MTVRELLNKPAKQLIITSLLAGIAIYFLNWFFKFINYSGTFSELKGDFPDKITLFIASYFFIVLGAYSFYDFHLKDVIEVIEESWHKKVIEERDWLHHKELINYSKAVWILRVITLCLLLIQMSIVIIVNKLLGNSGLASETLINFTLLLFFYFLWKCSYLVSKSVRNIKSKTLFFKWDKLYDFFYENKKISDAYYSKLRSEHDHLSHLRSKMQDFETIEIDTKLSKIKYLLLEIQYHLEEFKNKRVQFIISEIPEKVRRFYRGNTDTNFGNNFTPEFIALSEKIGVSYEDLTIYDRNKYFTDRFPHNYFDFHVEEINEKDIQELNYCISNVENINKNYSAIILNPKIAREIDEYFK